MSCVTHLARSIESTRFHQQCNGAPKCAGWIRYHLDVRKFSEAITHIPCVEVSHHECFRSEGTQSLKALIVQQSTHQTLPAMRRVQMDVLVTIRTTGIVEKKKLRLSGATANLQVKAGADVEISANADNAKSGEGAPAAVIMRQNGPAAIK
jgi:hypothetical protein